MVDNKSQQQLATLQKNKNLLLSSDSHFQREVTQGDSTIAHEYALISSVAPNQFFSQSFADRTKVLIRACSPHE